MKPNRELIISIVLGFLVGFTVMSFIINYMGL
jgi:hypothetical protein